MRGGGRLLHMRSHHHHVMQKRVISWATGVALHEGAKRCRFGHHMGSLVLLLLVMGLEKHRGRLAYSGAHFRGLLEQSSG